MTTHNFHNKRTLMRIGCTTDSVDALDNPMKGCVSTNRHVGTAEVIVD